MTKKVSLSVDLGGRRIIKKKTALTHKGREKYNRETGSDLKAPSKDHDNARHKSFCARSEGWTGERGKAARKRWDC
jgi:hypothetical protein